VSTETEKTTATEFHWLIEMQGPAYLAVRHLGNMYEFHWTNDASTALKSPGKHQASLLMLAIRQLRPDLFPACLTSPIAPMEHGWFVGEGFRKTGNS